MAEDKYYQSLYRKYRPQGPHEVLGQEHVVRALMGAVREGRLAHAFLFSGPRGTGKTSTARILAKMVNCDQGPTAEPCGSCEQCLRIRDGSHVDVVEIDAASHGGVDDARELREKAPTAPLAGREKVYIIDEAQRLSREAFDALLKVFEEPPQGVRFVLATTEPHKMPATIIGRCQRFDFRRVSLEVVAEHLEHVAKEEGFELAAAAAHAIARQTEGSVRDALSLLDQAAVLGGGEVGEEVVAALLGSPRSEVQHELSDAVAVGDAKAVFGVVHRLVQEGQDLRHVTAETLGHFRNLLIAQSAPGQSDLLDVTEDEYERLRASAAKFQPAELSRVIGLLLDAQADMRWTTSPRMSLELALIRATLPETDPNPHALISRIERLERLAGVEAGSRPAPPAPAEETPPREEVAPPAEAKVAPPAEAKDAVPLAEPPAAEAKEAVPAAEPPAAERPSPEAPAAPEPAAEPVAAAAPSASTGPAVDVDLLRRSWPSLIEHLQQARQPVLKALLESATPVAYDGDTLDLAFPPDRTFGVTKVEAKAGDLQEALRSLFGIAPAIRCTVREPVAGAPELEEEEPPRSDEEALRRIQAELDAQIAPEG